MTFLFSGKLGAEISDDLGATSFFAVLLLDRLRRRGRGARFRWKY
jgi:hypothetical protein